LAASIAHELNNPLATVSLRSEVLLAEMAPDAPQRRALEVIEQEVERMGQLVSNLLQFTRRGQQQVSTLDVCEEIEHTLELIHYHLRNRHIAVVCQFAPDMPMVQADRQQLRQLFLNLFTNASDAMPQGGTLTLQVRTDPLSQQLKIAISDTGMGIAAEDLPRVMEPFFTTKPEGLGTGLGLPICRRIVQEHQGNFTIVSTVQQGTTVFITLPTQYGQNGGSFIEA
jgi:signal transduction histidine kinase